MRKGGQAVRAWARRRAPKQPVRKTRDTLRHKHDNKGHSQAQTRQQGTHTGTNATTRGVERSGEEWSGG
eukprot:262221-Pyramimonas_sp.AAC.1